jgi:hypothetical protein
LTWGFTYTSLAIADVAISAATSKKYFMIITSMTVPLTSLVINMTPVFICAAGMSKSCGAGDCQDGERDKFFHLLLPIRQSGVPLRLNY